MDEKLSFLRSQPGPKNRFQRTKVKVKSPDNYVLYETTARICVNHTNQGLKLVCRKPISIPAEKLLGPRIREALVHDVEFCFTEITLSAKKLGVTNLPCRVKEGDVVEFG